MAKDTKIAYVAVALLTLLLTASTLISSIFGQSSDKIGATPKEVLNPKTYNAIAEQPFDILMDQLRSQSRKLDSFEQQYVILQRRADELSANMRVISAQQQNIMDDYKVISVAVEDISELKRRMVRLEQRLDEHETRGSTVGVNLAVLETKINAIIAGVSALVLSALGVLGSKAAVKLLAMVRGRRERRRA